jgi:hypothetical protein
MPIIIRMVVTLVITNLLLPWMACGSERHIAKRPEGLRMENPDPSDPYLTPKDRALWKSTLNWCDECDERAGFSIPDEDRDNGWIFIYPIGDKQYIVKICCAIGMHNSENLFYKVWVNKDSIESRLLILEQYDYFPADDEEHDWPEDWLEKPKFQPEPKGQFVRFTDSLAYGFINYPPANTLELILSRKYRGAGGCGLYTVYDVSGESPKVKEFRARVFCTPESPPFEKWKRYPAQQRAKWRVVPNSLREDWKSSPFQFEARCGWYYSDPAKDDFSMFDREGEWTISNGSGKPLIDESNRPAFTPDQKIKTKSGDEYGCVCMDAKVSLKSRRFFEIKNTRVQPLDACRQDPGLKRWKHSFK